MFWRSVFVRLFFFCWSLCCLFFFDMWIMVVPLVSSNSSYRIYNKKLIKLSKFTKRICCQFSQYYWRTLHKLSKTKTDDETTILVVYDIYFINQLLKKTIIKTETQKNKQIKNKQKTNKQKQTKK